MHFGAGELHAGVPGEGGLRGEVEDFFLWVWNVLGGGVVRIMEGDADGEGGGAEADAD